jgi:hypothetical protein
MIQKITDNKPFQLALYCLVGAFSLLLFLKNAWIAEDAFIILRTADQFMHGHGFRWNPQERAQAYTSPLWFLLIIVSTCISNSLYINVISLSLLLHVGLLLVMARFIPTVWRWVAAVLLLTLSQGFFDFTASGLEYPLVYALLGSFVLLYLRNQYVKDRFWLALTAGLMLTTRHDLLLLILPLLIHLAWQFHKTLTGKQQIVLACLFMAPLFCWTLFSVLYYGFPFPNTAYAKLSTPGVVFEERLRRGLLYVNVSLKTDPITPAIIVIAFIKSVFSSNMQQRLIAACLALAFTYITIIGGDYMIGRFYAPLYLVSVLLLTLCSWQKPFINKPAVFLVGLSCGYLLINIVVIHAEIIQQLLSYVGVSPLTSAQPAIIACVIIGVALAIFGICTHHKGRYTVATLFSLLLLHSTQQNDSPWQTSYKDWGKTADFDYWWMIDTVSRERYWIYRWTSLYAWLHQDPQKPFPDHPWCHEGKALPPVSIVRYSGMMPYCMDNTHIAVDIQGLTDAFVARMPRNPKAEWLSGGVNRVIPAGYLESLKAGQNLIQDPEIARYYNKLALITQSQNLFAYERLTEIVKFNLGAYDSLLDKNRQQVAHLPNDETAH